MRRETISSVVETLSTFALALLKKWNFFAERAEEIELKPTYNFVVLNFRELKFKFRLENIYSTIF